MLLLLPLELWCLILELSSGSPKSLEALARTHTSYQREALAERALYNALSIYSFRDTSLQCLETLATKLEKAALVRFMTVEYRDYATFYLSNNDINKNKNQRVTTYLSKSLINMHSLSDFRIGSCPTPVTEDHAQTIKGLGKILWSA